MKKTIILFAFLTISLLSFSQKETVTLFNRKDLTNWKMVPHDKPGFEVQDGILVAKPQNGSNLFSEKWYGNYIFKFEYLLSEVGNSGALIRSDPENAWGTGVEVQLLAPWTPYRDDLHCTGSMYGLVAVHNRPDETTGIWHEMEIKCDRQNVTISVDGQITTVAKIDTVKGMENKNIEGAVGFQGNHGKKGEFVKFRNISIQDFDTDPEYVAKGFYENDARFRQQAHKSAVSIGAPMIDGLTKMLSQDNVMAKAGAKQVLFDIVAQATAPDVSKLEKKNVIKALKKNLKQSKSKSVSEYLDFLQNIAESKK
ncbi:MAG: DUF1080 domain-containing protein [Dysgonamonadaceae bacterium]|nr:DUF1080 domain-containing protein [Dysgonamonadaceae bacterium]